MNAVVSPDSVEIAQPSPRPARTQADEGQSARRENTFEHTFNSLKQKEKKSEASLNSSHSSSQNDKQSRQAQTGPPGSAREVDGESRSIENSANVVDERQSIAVKRQIADQQPRPLVLEQQGDAIYASSDFTVAAGTANVPQGSDFNTLRIPEYLRGQQSQQLQSLPVQTASLDSALGVGVTDRSDLKQDGLFEPVDLQLNTSVLTNSRAQIASDQKQLAQVITQAQAVNVDQPAAATPQAFNRLQIAQSSGMVGAELAPGTPVLLDATEISGVDSNRMSSNSHSSGLQVLPGVSSVGSSGTLSPHLMLTESVLNGSLSQESVINSDATLSALRAAAINSVAQAASISNVSPNTANAASSFDSGQVSLQGMLNTQSAVLQLTSPLHSDGWRAEAFARLTVLAGKGLDRAELQLQPASLGKLVVRMDSVDDTTRLSFTVQSAHARDQLELHLPKLREMFAQSGLDLLDVDVRDQSSQSGEDYDPTDRLIGHGEMAGAGLGEESQDMFLVTTNQSKSAILDTFA